MTILIGVLCKDGVVIGSDSAVTFATGNIRTIEQSIKKVDIISEHVIVAGTGEVGLGQRFTEVVKQAWENKIFSKSALEIGKELARAGIEDFGTTSATMGRFGALVAFPCNGGHPVGLCELSVDNFQPELKTDRLWYVSMGSGQTIVDPFLGLMREAFWEDGLPSHQDATFAVTWALQHAIDLNAGGVNGPIQVGVLSSSGKGKYDARLLTEEELAGHQENVAGVIEHLREYRGKINGSAIDTPDVPTPGK